MEKEAGELEVMLGMMEVMLGRMVPNKPKECKKWTRSCFRAGC